METYKARIEDLKEVQLKRNGQIVKIKVSMNSGKKNKYIITVGRKDT